VHFLLLMLSKRFCGFVNVEKLWKTNRKRDMIWGLGLCSTWNILLATSCSCSFSRLRNCVARVPVSLWGSGRWGCVRSTLRLRPQPFATVRNRPQPSATVRNRLQPFAAVCAIAICAYGKFCRRGAFWMFQRSRCFVLRGRRGTSWHSDVFCNVSKVVLCGGHNTFPTWKFSWQAQHFGSVHRDFAWQTQRFRRVVLRALCESHWQGCIKWRQGADSVAGVTFCEMCWKVTEASHETSILR